MRHHTLTRLLAFLAVSILFMVPERARGAAADEMHEPAAVIRAYLRAVYARDFSEAYRYISPEDHRAKSRDQYLRQRAPFSGFALEITKRLAAAITVEITTLQAAGSWMILAARYNAPDQEKIAPLLRLWNGYQLNSLSGVERQQLIEAIERSSRAGSLEMISGQETLTLVKTGAGWRIFFDWARGVTIPLRALVTEPKVLDVSLSPEQTVLQPGSVFDVMLKITNRSRSPLVVRIGHLIRPKELADFLEIVHCGFLLPVKLQPGIEQEYSGTYLLRGSLPEGVRQLDLDYDFRPTHEK